MLEFDIQGDIDSILEFDIIDSLMGLRMYSGIWIGGDMGLMDRVRSLRGSTMGRYVRRCIRQYVR